MLTIMDLIEGMRTFQAVAQTGSFTDAAERLGISRALTSKYVAQLEDRLGLRLLHRTTRSVSLTDFGRAYLDRCARLLDEFDELEATVRQGRAAPRGSIRMSAPSTFGELFLPKILSEFNDSYPEISIALSLTDRYVNLVHEGFDIAIRIGALADSSLIARKLTQTRLIACATLDYLSRNGFPAVPSDLTKHQCVLDDNLRDGERWSFVAGGVSETVAVGGPLRVNSANSVREWVLQGKGIGFCPSFLVAADIRAERLREVLPNYQTPDFGIYAVYPHSRHLAANVRLLIDDLIEKLPLVCA